MSRQPQSVHWDSLEHDKAHREKVIAKASKIQTLKALIDTWESHTNPDYDYLSELRARLRSTEAQFNAMAP